MDLFPSSDRLESSQFLTPTTQPFEQTTLTYVPSQVEVSSQVDYLPTNPFPLLVVCAYLAAVFFYIGAVFGKRPQTRRDRKAVRQQQIQALERIWQITPKRKY